MGESIEVFFVGDCSVSSTAFMGIGFPNAPARVYCLTRFDLRVGCSLVGCCFCFASGVAFWLIRLGDGARFSDMDDPESVPDPGVAAPSFSCLWFDWNSIPRVGVLGAGRPPVLFPIAFRFEGLFCYFLRVNFTGSPDASSLNIGCRSALGFSISKKRKQGPDLRADLYAT